jgi:uncharacterized membrane protein YdjX (TVP38/TMEM64 family)
VYPGAVAGGSVLAQDPPGARAEALAGEAVAVAAPPAAAAAPARPLWWRAGASRGFVLLLLLAAAGYGISRGLDALGGPEAVRDRFGWLAPVVSALVHAPLAASPFPSEVFAISHGALYGFWLGALVGWGGWWLGSLIEYLVLLRWRFDVGPAALAFTRPRWLARLPFDHPAFLIGARQLPWGYHLVNVAVALTGVPFFRHLWCSAVSQIPSALFISALGVGLLKL